MDQTPSKPSESLKDNTAARRKFLADCGKFAAVTPPIVALLLSADSRKHAYAVAASGRPT
jgi:hypothetical protein